MPSGSALKSYSRCMIGGLISWRNPRRAAPETCSCPYWFQRSPATGLADTSSCNKLEKEAVVWCIWLNRKLQSDAGSPSK